MRAERPSRRVIRDAGLVVLPGRIQPREARAWLVGWQGTRGVLRQVPLPADGFSRTRLTEDMTWLHGFLVEIAELGFPAPRPLPCFGGRSWTIADGMGWEIVSFLPGQAIGWSAEPGMQQVGALLARYHTAARRVNMTGQRPGALALADVPAILLSGQLPAVCTDQDRAATIRRLADQLAQELALIGHPAGQRLVIHGDFTNHNVIADGTPPRPTGVIDFALAHVETPLADIGYGLWRSGRPYQDADHLALPRIQQFLRGYASIVPVSADQAGAIPAYLRGRGLQMIAKRIRAGRAETGMLAQVQWLSANAGAIGDALAAVLP